MPDGPDRQVRPALSGPPARLKNRRDFIRASAGGRVHSRSFSLQVLKRRAESDAVQCCRVGLTVTKKVGGAVERNRIKRRLREALRAPDLATMQDHDYVIVARREALTAPFTRLLGELRRCLGEAKTGRAKAVKIGAVKATSGRHRGSGPRGGLGGDQPVSHS